MRLHPRRGLVLGLQIALISLAPALHAGEKETYGVDDRRDMYEVTDPFIRALADSVCALMDDSSLRDNGNGTFTVLSVPNVVEGNFGGQIPMCDDEPFANQEYAAFCSGFLVKPDIIATAGHCTRGTDPSTIRVVFGWEMLNASTPVTTLQANQVYRVEEVLEESLNFMRDHAILGLDRPVTAPGAQPLEVRQRGRVELGAPVGVIGHPMGLPKKVAFGTATEIYGNLRPFVFYSNFDASGGNSGSPVFNQETGVVEGIYVFSDVPDFIQDGTCFRVNQVSDEEAAQGVMRSTNFAHLIPGNQREKLLPVCGAPAGAPGANGLIADAAIITATLLLLSWPALRRSCSRV